MALDETYDASWDAWNRLVLLEDATVKVAEYQYDGFNRRTLKETYTSGGALDQTRHFYYSQQWQVLEERVDSSTNADRQFLWGLRYIDDLALRDRDTSSPANGVLDERLYSLQDALFNVVALTDNTGTVKERFAYTPYGVSKPLDPDFTPYTGSDYNWEYRFTGRRLDLGTGLQLNRNRYLHLQLGRWLSRDPIGYRAGINLLRYVRNKPIVRRDAKGLVCGEGDCCGPPAPGFPNSYCERIIGIAHAPNGANPGPIEGLQGAIDDFQILQAILGIIQIGAQQTLQEVLEELLDQQAEGAIDLTDQTQAAIEKLIGLLVKNLGFGLAIYGEWYACVEAPWYSSCCYRFEKQTGIYVCRPPHSAENPAGLWGGKFGGLPSSGLTPFYDPASGQNLVHGFRWLAGAGQVAEA